MRPTAASSRSEIVASQHETRRLGLAPRGDGEKVAHALAQRRRIGEALGLVHRQGVGLGAELRNPIARNRGCASQTAG